MKGFVHLIIDSCVAIRISSAILAWGNKAPTAAATNTPSTAAGIFRGASNIVMKEVGGIPGNECLTLRNNGQCLE